VTTRGIQLRRLGIERANHWHLRVSRLRVEVIDTCGDMDANVFVYRRNPVNPNTGEVFDEWCAIASPVDLSEYPVGSPATGQLYDEIKAQVTSLVTALDLADKLTEEEKVWVGCEPAESESASASESESASA